MPDDTQKFLEAEEQASRLLKELEALRKEAASHAASTEALEESAESLSKLAGRVGELAEELGAMVQSARELGIPGLLEEHEGRYREQVSEALGTVSGEIRSVEAELTSGLKSTSEESRKRLGELSTSLETTIQKATEDSEVAILESVGQAVERVETSAREVEARAGNQLQAIHKRVTLVGVLLGIGLLVVLGLLVWPLVSAG